MWRLSFVLALQLSMIGNLFSVASDSTAATLGNQGDTWEVRGQEADDGADLLGDQVGSVDASSLAVTAGELHSCSLDDGGTVTCWGSNTSGQLGDGTTTRRLIPTPVLHVENAVKVSAGRGHSCALTSSGEIYCWGSNTSGQLGAGTRTIHRLEADLVSGINNAVDIATGAHHSCALLASDVVQCWGSNGTGQLGDGTTTDRSLPVQSIGLASISSITAGGGHTCGLSPAGTVNCWGSNFFGELGDGTTRERLAATTTAGITDAIQLAAGDLHTCALRSNGSVMCWGYNHHGHLGDGTTTHRAIPVAVVGVSDATSIATGDAHSCAVRQNGTVLCWGSNSDGQLGDGTTTVNRLTPVTAVGVSDAVSMAAGGSHTCTTRANGAIDCWGTNNWGQLGNATDDPSSTPVLVVRDPPDVDPAGPSAPTDPQSVISRGPADDQILRLYRAAFGRYPDPEGFEFWINHYREGATLHSIAEFFLTSEESEIRYGGDPTDLELIESMYLNILQRAGEPEGVDYWLRRREVGLSRPDLLILFSDSPENILRTGTREPLDSKQSQILRIYQAVFGRLPDADGMEFWTTEYRNGRTYENIASFFAISPEFRTAFGESPTDEEIVEALYRNVLRREGETEGVQYWLTRRRDGLSIVELLTLFANSPENLTLTGTIP